MPTPVCQLLYCTTVLFKVLRCEIKIFFSYFCLLGPFICVKIIINLFQYRTMCVCKSVMSNSVTPSTVALARLLCPWNSPGKNTRVGTHPLLQGNLPHPEIKPRFPALKMDSLQSELPGKPIQNYRTDSCLSWVPRLTLLDLYEQIGLTDLLMVQH